MPSGMTGAVLATNTWSPTTTAREYPKRASQGAPDEMSFRSTALLSAAVEALEQVDDWQAENVAAGAVRAGSVVAVPGQDDREFRWASVTKPVTALALLVAAEEGTVDLDEPAGPPGFTVRYLLAHA